MKYILLNPFITKFEACNNTRIITVDSALLPKVLAKSSRWSISTSSRYQGIVTCGGGNEKVALHRYLCDMDKSDTRDVDHINGNRYDNRMANLRVCSHQQNMFNIGHKRTNSSGYIGVHWSAEKNKWCARIRINGNKKHLGYFFDIKEAARAVDKVLRETRGEFAILNFPTDGGAI